MTMLDRVIGDFCCRKWSLKEAALQGRCLSRVMHRISSRSLKFLEAYLLFPMQPEVRLHLLNRPSFSVVGVHKRSRLMHLGPPLSFFDNYEIVSGVPAFTYETEGDESRPFGRVYAVSFDGSCLAISPKPNHIQY